MKIKINRIHYPSLRNDEFIVVYKETVAICEAHNVSSLRVEKSYGELLSFRSEVESLSVQLRSSALVAQMNFIDHERDLLINGITRAVKVLEHLDFPEITPHVDVLLPLLDKHDTRTIAAAARTVETERLEKFEKEINADVAFQNAFAGLNLSSAIQRLFELNREYKQLFRLHISESGAEPAVRVAELRRNSSKALTQFFDAVQYGSYLYDDLNYAPFVAEITQLHQYYNRQIKARDTRRKNGAKVSEEPAIPPMNRE
jgi:hypothetical protein